MPSQFKFLNVHVNGNLVIHQNRINPASHVLINIAQHFRGHPFTLSDLQGPPFLIQSPPRTNFFISISS